MSLENLNNSPKISCEKLNNENNSTKQIVNMKEFNEPVTWLDDDETEKLDFSIRLDSANMFFNRVNSAEIIYQSKKKPCKMIGKYVMGDVLGEGWFFVVLLFVFNYKKISVVFLFFRFIRQS